jgi:hypothetical protein
MELSYGKLFSELGFAFLKPKVDQSELENMDEEDLSEYKEFNDKFSSTLDELTATIQPTNVVKQSQMDKIKVTLDDLRTRINVMRRQFKLYIIKLKRNLQASKNGLTSDEDVEDQVDDDEIDDEDFDNEDLFKICVYVKEQGNILTFKVHRKCKIRDLKNILYEKVADQRDTSIDDLILSFNNRELINDLNTVSDYNIIDNSTITLEFDERL